MAINFIDKKKTFAFNTDLEKRIFLAKNIKKTQAAKIDIDLSPDINKTYYENVYAVQALKSAIEMQKSTSQVIHQKGVKTFLGAPNVFIETQEDEGVKKALEGLLQNKIFDTILESNKTINPINIDNFANTNISASAHKLDKVYKKVQEFKNLKQGVLHTIDTETLGATSLTNIWRPSYITEFAKYSYDFSNPNKSTSTNIIINNKNTIAEMEKEYKRIVSALTSGKSGIELIESDPSLRVSMERFSLYGHKNTVLKFNESKGYSEILSIAQKEDLGSISNLDLITKGFEKLKKHQAKDVDIKVGNKNLKIGADVTEFINSIYQINNDILTGEGIVSGYNIKNFDFKVINSTIQNMARNNADVEQYVKFLWQTDSIAKIGINPNSENILDIMDFTRIHTQRHGQDSLINLNPKMKDFFSRIYHKGANRQENLGQVMYSNLMGNAHAAIADTIVASNMVTTGSDVLNNKSLIEYIYEGSIKDIVKNEKRKANMYTGTNGTLFIANKGTYYKKDRSVLDFVLDKDGVKHFNAGFSIDAKGNLLDHSKFIVSPSTGIEKGGVYGIKGIKTVDASSFGDLSKYIPEYSSGQLHVLELVRPSLAVGESRTAEESIFKVFSSADELHGFINSNLTEIGNQKDTFFHFTKGMGRNIIPEMSEHLVDETSSMNLLRSYIDLSTSQRIKNKAHNYVFYRENGLKTATQALDLIKQLEKTPEYTKFLKDPMKFVEVLTSDNLDSAKYAKDLKNAIVDTFGYTIETKAGKKVKTMNPNSLRSVAYSLNHFYELKNYYTNMVGAVLNIDPTKMKNATFSQLYNTNTTSKKTLNKKFDILRKQTIDESSVKLAGVDFLNDDLDTITKKLQKAEKIASFTDGPKLLTRRQIKDRYDFELLNYGKKPVYNKIDSFGVLNNTTDYISLDLTKDDFLDKLLSKWYGDTKRPQNESQLFKHKREAFDDFILNISNNEKYNNLFSYKTIENGKEVEKLTKLGKIVSEKGRGYDFYLKSDYNLNEAFNALKSQVEIIKGVEGREAGIYNIPYLLTSDVDKGLAKILNSSYSINDLTGILSNINVSAMPKDTRYFSKNIANKYIKFNTDEVSNYYKNLYGKNSFEYQRQTRLINSFKANMATKIEDIIEATRIKGANLDLVFDSNTGELGYKRGKDFIKLMEMPQLKFDNGTLYIETLSGSKMEYHEALKFIDGKITLGTNLDGNFMDPHAITRTVRRSVEKGENPLNNISGVMVKNASEYKSGSAHLDFTSKTYLSTNAKLDVRGAHEAFYRTFGMDADGSVLKKLIDEGKLTNTQALKYFDNLKLPAPGKDIELSPDKWTMLIDDINAIFMEFAKDEEVKSVIKNMNTTGKATDVAKGILSTGTMNVSSITNYTDNLGRDPIVASQRAYYLRTNDIKEASKKVENLLVSGNIVNTKTIMDNIDKQLKIGLDDIGVSPDFIHSQGYIGTIGLTNILNNEADRVINEYKFSKKLTVSSPEELVGKLYGGMTDLLSTNTYEQSRILDTSVFKALYGEVPQDVQKFSKIRDLYNGLDNTLYRNSKLREAIDVVGDVTIDENNRISYKKSAGTIVRRGENIFTTKTYSGEASFGSKFDIGVFNFNIRNKQGMELTEKEISDILTEKLQKELTNKSREEAQAILERYKTKEGILSAFIDGLGDNYTATYEIANANSADLVKMYTGGAEKGMSAVPMNKIGSIDTTLANLMKLTGHEDAVGFKNYSSGTVKAIISDYSKNKSTEDLHGIVDILGLDKKALGITSTSTKKEITDKLMSHFASVRDAEQNVFSEMLFDHVFKGRVSTLVNDNVIGHRNVGVQTAGYLSRVTELYGKHLIDDSKLSNEEKYQKAIDEIATLINNNEKFNFYKTSGDKNKIKLSRKDNTYIVEGLENGFDDYSMINLEGMHNLLEEVDKKLEAKGVSAEDRLVHKNIYTMDKDGKLIKNEKLYGSYFTRQIKNEAGETITIADGAIHNAAGRYVLDSETQSSMSYKFLEARKKFIQSKDLLRQYRKTNDIETIDLLENSIEKLEHYIKAAADSSRPMSIDDQFVNILRYKNLDSNLEHKLSNKFKQGKMSEMFLDAAKDYVDIDKDGKFKIKQDFATGSLYKDWIDEKRELITYDPTKERLITKDMVNSKNYSEFKDLYEYTDKLGLRLGEDSADRLYDLQGAYKSYFFNKDSIADESKMAELINKYSFKEMSINDYASTFGTLTHYSDSLVHYGHIFDLGSEFDNKKIAIPRFGSFSGDGESLHESQQMLNDLARRVDNYNRSYINKAHGNEEAERMRNGIMSLVDDINDSIGNMISKSGGLGKSTKVQLNDPYHRMKLLTVGGMEVVGDTIKMVNNAVSGDVSEETMKLINEASWKNKAQINGKTIREWEKGGFQEGTFFNYGVAGMGHFENAGFFEQDYLNKVGMSREQMIEHLQTHGTMEFADRYPNIREESVVNSRIFLDAKRGDNTISMGFDVNFKVKGDHDGDSMSLALIRHGDVDYTSFSINREKAKQTLDASSLTKEEYNKRLKETTIANLKDTHNLAIEDAEKIYKNFSSYEAMTFLDAINNKEIMANDALNALLKDQSRSYKVGGIEVGAKMEGISFLGAEIEGGKSILGKVKLLEMQKAPGALDELGGTKWLSENTNKLNELLTDIASNKDTFLNMKEVQDGNYKYLDKLLNSDMKNISAFDREMHQGLDEMLSLVELDKKSGKNVLKTSYEDAEAMIVNRIRTDTYNSNAVSKGNKGVIGQVNASLYSIRQASHEIYGINDATKYSNSVINALGYDFEEHVISSKKVNFDPQDLRLVKLSGYINDIKSGSDINASKRDITNWIDEYMSGGKIDEIYNKVMDEKMAPKNHLNLVAERTKEYMQKDNISEKLATTKAKASILADEYVTSVNALYSSKEGKALIDFHGVINRSSGNLEKLSKIDFSQVTMESYGATATSIVTGQIGKTVDQLPKFESKEYVERAFENSKVATGVGKQLLSGASDLFRGVSSSGIALGVIGLAAGLLIGGYASGNPLKDPKNDHIENQPQEIEHMSIPEFFEKDSGYASTGGQKGYVINLRAETRRGQKFAKKAIRQAVSATAGGGVNINMNFRSNNSSGFSDKDIEDIISNYM